MKFILVLSFLFSSVSIYAKTLVLIGGGDRPSGALSYFVKKVDRSKSIVVLPWGTNYPQESFETIRIELISAGASFEKLICLCDRNLTPDDLHALVNAGGIYFPGGNQNLIMETISRYKLKGLIHTLYENHVPIAGTSAGTAIQSDPMLSGNGSETVEGLGLLKGIIVDQHFHKRRRQQRLLDALKRNQGFQGLGIDEDMGLVIVNDKKFIPIGPSIVSLYIYQIDEFLRVDLRQ